MTSNAPAPSGLARDVDRLSLEQALRDFEIANARAIDLTQRLVDLSKEVTRLREQVIDAQMQAAGARAENDALRASTTFRLVELSSKIRRKLAR
jgi:predicted  nucleic acid-binding Zn-ribbon protein